MDSQEYTGMDGSHYNNENGIVFSPILASLGKDKIPEHHIQIKTPDGQIFSLRLQKNPQENFRFFLYHGEQIGKENPSSEAHDRPHALKSYDLSEIVSGSNKYQNIIKDMKNSFLSEMKSIYLLLPTHDRAICIVQMTPQEICKFSQQQYLSAAILGIVADTFSSDHYPSFLCQNSDVFYTHAAREDKKSVEHILSQLNKNHCVIFSCETISSELQEGLKSIGMNLNKDDSKFEWRLSKTEEKTACCYLAVGVENPKVQIQMFYELPEALEILKGFIKTAKDPVETSNDSNIFCIQSPDSNFLPNIPSTFSSGKQNKDKFNLSRRRTDTHP